MLEEDLIELMEFIQQPTKLIIPRKINKAIDYIPIDLLNEIHQDKEVAKEMCLYFISFLNEIANIKFESEWYYTGRPLLSSKLAMIFRSARSNNQNNVVYKAIIEALKIGTLDKGPIIEVNESYLVGNYCRKYNLTETYKNKGFEIYNLETKYVMDIKFRNHLELMSLAETNLITKNLLKLYPFLDLPTETEILEHGKQLCKQNYLTKKGKKLTMKYTKNISYWKDAESRSFVENNIEKYLFYTQYGFMIPIIGNDNCPRVFDSLTLIPSWIRSMIKYNGKEMIELDFKCLHPNIIMTLYGGTTRFITHQLVADKLKLDKDIIKKQHLSFFNLETKHFCSSRLYTYYNLIEQDVIKKILIDKENGIDTHTLLFNKEVELMSNIIAKLNRLEIYPIYIYDALMVVEEHKDIVIKIMNDTALEMEIFTNV